MPEKKTPPPVAPVALPEQWSAISQGAMGYKAGFRSEDGAIKFKPILGWITCSVRHPDQSIKNTFHAVVRAPFHLPAPVDLMQGFCGIFEEHTSPEEAEELTKQWKLSGKPQMQITQGPAKA